MGEYSSDTFKLSIVNEKDVTPDEILGEADGIWKRLRNLTYAPEASDDVMQEVRTAHRDFSKSYPIVLRYMVQFRSYNHKAFKLYLAKIGKHPWKSEEEYLDSQADYAVLLYKSTHKKWNTSQMRILWNNIRNSLGGESAMFKKYHEEFTKEVTDDEKRLADEFRAETIALLIKHAELTDKAAEEELCAGEKLNPHNTFEYQAASPAMGPVSDSFVDEEGQTWIHFPKSVLDLKCDDSLTIEEQMEFFRVNIAKLEGLTAEHSRTLIDWYATPKESVYARVVNEKVYARGTCSLAEMPEKCSITNKILTGLKLTSCSGLNSPPPQQAPEREVNEEDSDEESIMDEIYMKVVAASSEPVSENKAQVVCDYLNDPKNKDEYAEVIHYSMRNGFSKYSTGTDFHYL